MLLNILPSTRWLSSPFAPITRCCFGFAGTLQPSDRWTLRGWCRSLWSASTTASQDVQVTLTFWILSVWLVLLSKYSRCSIVSLFTQNIWCSDIFLPWAASHIAGLDSKYFERRPDSIAVYNPSSNPPSRGNTVSPTIFLDFFFFTSAGCGPDHHPGTRFVTFDCFSYEVAQLNIPFTCNLHISPRWRATQAEF